MAKKLDEFAALALLDLAKAGRIEVEDVYDEAGTLVNDQILIRGVNLKEVEAEAEKSKPRKRGGTPGKKVRTAI